MNLMNLLWDAQTLTSTNLSDDVEDLEQSVSELHTLLTELAQISMKKIVCVLVALVLLFFGIKLVKWIIKLIHRYFERSNLDPTVTSFLESIIKLVLYVLLGITAVSIVGIQVTSFVTLLGTTSVTVGLALQGSLANLAGGVLILILKPFVVGDYIKEDTHGNEGTVTGIDIFYTRLITIDGKTVVVPNGVLSNSSLTNLTKENKRRLDLSIPIEYSENIKRVRDVLSDILMKSDFVLKDQTMDIVVNSFDESSVELAVHVWVSTENYWKAKWQLMEEIKVRFDEENITIPFNQLDVHMEATK